MLSLLTIAVELISIVLGLLAAYYWHESTKVETPESFAITVVKPRGQHPGNPLAGEWMGQGYSNDLASLGEGLRKQSRINATAARLTAGSVLAQAIAVALQLVKT
jgi:hypothetical protein